MNQLFYQCVFQSTTNHHWRQVCKMQKLLSIVLLLQLLLIHQIHGFDGFIDCGSQLSEVSSVRVYGSKIMEDRFILARDQNAMFIVVFKTKEPIYEARNLINSIIGSSPVTFPLPNDDACRRGLPCPLEPDESYEYMLRVPVNKYYPPGEIDIRWELLNEYGEPIFCVTVPGKIEGSDEVNEGFPFPHIKLR